MADNKQLLQIRKATWDVVNSLHETNQTAVESFITLQDHNLRFAQHTFQNWMDLLTHQTEGIQHVQQQWEQQIQKQQGAFQKLMPPLMQISMDFLLAPFTLSRKLVEASMTATQREREPVEASMTATQRERELVP
jgi:hypothetical protein